MKYIHFIPMMCLGATVFAQDVQYDYDRSADFSSYKTYQWVERRLVPAGDQLLDHDIKRSVDEQFAGKGMRRVETGGDLQVNYQGAVTQEKEFDYICTGPGFGPGWWGGDGRVTSSTVDVGKLVIQIFDPAKGQLVWRGAASKTLNISKDPDKNYRTLEKAMAKLFKNYPPGAGKR